MYNVVLIKNQFNLVTSSDNLQTRIQMINAFINADLGHVKWKWQAGNMIASVSFPIPAK